MSHKFQDIGIASQIAAYSDAVEVKPKSALAANVRHPGNSRRPARCPRTYRAKPNSPGNISSRC